MPHRGAARAPRLVLLRRRPAHARDPERVPARTSTTTRRTPTSTSARPAPRSGDQTAGRITHFVAGIGTGGTITGVARYLKAQNPAVQIIGADPEGSVFSGGTGRPYLVEGVGEDFWPTTLRPVGRRPHDHGQRRRVVRRGAARHARGGAAHRRVVRHRGARRARRRRASSAPTHVVVVLLPDSGRGYLSKIFNDEWMMRFGFLRADGPTRRRRARGEARRVAGRRPIPELVLVTPDEPARRGVRADARPRRVAARRRGHRRSCRSRRRR